MVDTDKITDIAGKLLVLGVAAKIAGKVLDSSKTKCKKKSKGKYNW